MKTIMRFILLTLLSIAFYGCGGGGGGSDAPPTPAVQNQWDTMKWDQGQWA